MFSNIYNIIILFSSILGYKIFLNYSKSNIIDTETLWLTSLLFGSGLFCLIKSFQYLLLSKKTTAKILSRNCSDVNTGKIQDIGSYSRGYSYSFLINDDKYTMQKYFEFGSKYEVGDTVKVSIVNREKKIAIPIRAVYNIIFIGVILIYSSMSMK